VFFSDPRTELFRAKKKPAGEALSRADTAQKDEFPMQERFDLYSLVHKGIRHLMQGTLLRLGQMDLSDPAEVAATLQGLEEMLLFLDTHVSNEEVVHVAVDQRDPGHLVGVLRGDHDDHLRAIEAMRTDAAGLARSFEESAAARRARARHLYLAVSRFVAENLLHMAVEETEMNALLWRLFDDGELVGLWGKIVAKETPEQLVRGVRWIIPAVSSEERAQLLAGARMTMAPAEFERLIPFVRSLIPASEMEKLEAVLA
jgi:hypothetical protein